MGKKNKEKKKVNLPLLEVFGLSLILHLLALLVFGGITIYQFIKPKKPEFIAPPPQERINPEQLEYKMQIKKQQQKSARPRQLRMVVTQISEMNLPEFDIDLAPLSSRVNLSAVGKGSGLGSGFGRGSLGIGASAVNFFGIKDESERLIFILDASDWMLEDKKGGFNAYDIVKKEITRMISKLGPGTLFNVNAYNNRDVNLFSPTMALSNSLTNRNVSFWIDPINKNSGSRGAGDNNYDPADKILPMGKHVGQWIRSIQAAMEQHVDAIFLILSGWQWHYPTLSPDEYKKWLADKGWSDKDELKWQNAVSDARKWLEKENVTRQKRGLPPRIVHWIGDVVNEKYPSLQAKPSPKFDDEQVVAHLHNVAKKYYPDGNYPSVNIVMFVGKDESFENDEKRFKKLTRDFGGKFRVLEGLEGLKSVSEIAKENKKQNKVTF